MKRILVKCIRLYQKIFSRDYGPLSFFYPYGYCRFYPTCSEYCIQAIEKYNFFRGLLKGISRLFRCNPWNRGGFDSLL